MHIATIASIASYEKGQLPMAARGFPSPALDRGSGEYYGFALFIFATVLFVLWILWALLPDSALEKLGVGWYPNRCVSSNAA